MFAKARQLPTDKLEAAKQEFEHLIKIGILRPSRSSWASPLHMVKKTDGSWRPCGDYKALNAITEKDRYSLPFITDMAAFLHNKQIFTKIDLQRAYHQVAMNPADIPETAVITPFGLFEYTRMPFGLCNAAQNGTGTTRTQDKRI